VISKDASFKNKADGTIFWIISELITMKSPIFAQSKDALKPSANEQT
jgi:hypothetical protein